MPTLELNITVKIFFRYLYVPVAKPLAEGSIQGKTLDTFYVLLFINLIELALFVLKKSGHGVTRTTVSKHGEEVHGF